MSTTTMTPAQARDAEAYFNSDDYRATRSLQVAIQNANTFMRDGAPINDDGLQDFLDSATIIDEAAPGTFGSGFTIQFGYDAEHRCFTLIRNLTPGHLHFLLLEGSGE